jgi:hypothetical protein
MRSYFDFIDTGLLDRLLSSGQFPFSKYLFWDTPVEMIDTVLHKKYIIERVLVKGTLKDFYCLIKIYSKDEIVAAIKSSKVLDKKTVNFCSYYFKVPLNELHASSYYN